MKEASTARKFAVQALCAERGGTLALDRPEYRGLNGPVRALLHELVLGVGRHQFLLDAVLAQFLPDKLTSVPETLRAILRMGVHDLIFRPTVPHAIVVDECVELCGRQKRTRGFINAVLRRIGEALQPVTLEVGDIPLDRCTIACAPGRGWRLTSVATGQPMAFLPDFEHAPAQHLSRRFTLTEWFAGELLRLLPLEAPAAAAAACARQPLALRPVHGRSTVPQLLERLVRDGVEGARDCGPVVEIAAAGSVLELAAFREGLCVVQDATAAEIAPFVAPQPDETVLDLCAAPGGKSIAMAELMEGRGRITACHRAGAAAARLLENIERSGWKCITPHDLGTNAARLPAGPFDAALVDAPCSNSGVLAKRVEARLRLSEQSVKDLAHLQGQLLHTAAELVRSGGRLVYSTCSVLPQENEHVVQAFLAQHPQFTLDAEMLRYPQRTGRDGGYAARLLKRHEH